MSAFNMGTMIWLEGWLTKLRDSSWLIPPFQSRWVKRFFVLRSEGFADTKRYFLDEYKEETKRSLVKTYDLDRCEQVDSYLQLSDSTCVNTFTVFKWIFSIHLSKPCSHKKTEVYLVAKDETEMHEWVKSLCRVCHLEKQPGPSGVPAYSFNENEVPLLFNDMSASSGRSMDSLLDPPLSDVTSESRTGKNHHVRTAAMTYLHMKNARSKMGPRPAPIELRAMQAKANGSSRHTSVDMIRTCSSASGCSLSSSHQSGTTEDDTSSVHSTHSTATGVPIVPPRSRLTKQTSATSSTLGHKASISEAGSTLFTWGLPNGLGSGETIKINSCNLSLPPIVTKGSFTKQSLSTSCLSFPFADVVEGPPIDRSKKPPNLRIEVEDDRTYGNTGTLARSGNKMPHVNKKNLEQPKSAGPLSNRKDLDYFEPRSIAACLESGRNAKTPDPSDLDYIKIDAAKTQAVRQLIANSRGNGDS